MFPFNCKTRSRGVLEVCSSCSYYTTAVECKLITVIPYKDLLNSHCFVVLKRRVLLLNCMVSKYVLKSKRKVVFEAFEYNFIQNVLPYRTVYKGKPLNWSQNILILKTLLKLRKVVLKLLSIFYECLFIRIPLFLLNGS